MTDRRIVPPLPPARQLVTWDSTMKVGRLVQDLTGYAANDRELEVFVRVHRKEHRGSEDFFVVGVVVERYLSILGDSSRIVLDAYDEGGLVPPDPAP